jgi:hypothetical protein
MRIGDLQNFHRAMLAKEVLNDGELGQVDGHLLARVASGTMRFMPTRRELANATRALSMDAVQKANLGHPGAPMGMADIAGVLWRDVLKFNPGHPTWADRDCCVLSNGHASMLLYAALQGAWRW